MNVKGIASRYRTAAKEHGAATAATWGARDFCLYVKRRLATSTPPPGVIEQQTLFNDVFQHNDRVWVFWFDGGRADIFEELYPEYFDGEYQRAWNGGVVYSGDWAEQMLSRDMSGYGLFSVAPIRSLNASSYDGREWFDVVPEIDTGNTVNERLAALGYREMKSTGDVEISPGHCNESVREHMAGLDGGLIRYLKPHPPLDGLEDLTSGSQKARRTWHALWSGELQCGELEAAYRRTYHHAFEAAKGIIDELEGKVVITADHGECLGNCGQLYHGRRHAAHRHLCTVPWLKVNRSTA